MFKLFKRDVITFLVIRRHDLGCSEDKLRYIAVKPNASITTLRRKVWHLLDLPDYCDEVIILKSCDTEIPLTELRKGNDPQHPYLLEVWLPGRKGLLRPTYYRLEFSPACLEFLKGLTQPEYLSEFRLWKKDQAIGGSPTSHNMLTMGQSVEVVMPNETLLSSESTSPDIGYKKCDETDSTIDSISNDTVLLSKSNISPVTQIPNYHFSNKDSELSCRISSTSLLFKLQGKKSRDNFTNILFKMQSDLMNLGNKISDLEHRLPR